MKWFASAGIFSTMLVLVGCSNTAPPPVAPPPPSQFRVKVQSPEGVDVKVGQGRVEVKAPGTDVDVERKK